MRKTRKRMSQIKKWKKKEGCLLSTRPEQLIVICAGRTRRVVGRGFYTKARGATEEEGMEKSV